eukprot:c10329_g1_i2 orf=186-1100(-)
MPKERREELEAVVQAYYGGRSISQEDIAAATLVGRGVRNSSRRHRKRALAADKVLGLKEDDGNNTGDHEANTHCKDANFASGNASPSVGKDHISIKSGVLQDSEGTTFLRDSLVSNGLEPVEMILPGGTQSAAVEGFGGDNSVDTVLLLGSEKEILPSANNASQEDLGFSMLDDANNAALEDSDVEQESSNEVLVGDFENIHVTKDPDEGEEHLGVLSSGRRQKQRDSLLGHGPHGKKVVEMLLETEGEDGIVQFCQMWRSVFVESVKPTHLPAGWDILHSGHREFGEYSVYNPSKCQQMDGVK